ncbi:hypothetical protein B0H14DRAFT_3448892 [Mycena olivaceomarginata]|nr:hypothetical protein B0H14DRAFT_3448892 [Mycena olivaceomarginata]
MPPTISSASPSPAPPPYKPSLSLLVVVSPLGAPARIWSSVPASTAASSPAPGTEENEEKEDEEEVERRDKEKEEGTPSTPTLAPLPLKTKRKANSPPRSSHASNTEETEAEEADVKPASEATDIDIAAFPSPRSFRTTSTSFSVFFIVLVSWPLGKMMEQALPDYQVRLGRFSFSLNPGPFTAKEHVLIDIAGWALPFDPLPSTDLTCGAETRARKETSTGGRRGASGAVLLRCSCGVFVWQFFPECIFPMTAAVAPVCWFAGHNKAASFVGSGMGGMGGLNIAIITRPFFVQVILFVGFVITSNLFPQMWILVPLACFGNKWGSLTFSMMSNGLCGLHY